MMQDNIYLLFVMCLAPVFIFFIGAGMLSVLKKQKN